MASSSMVQAWMVAPWPMVTLSPMMVGCALLATLCLATCTTQLSWMFVNAPTLMPFTSPRSTVPYLLGV